MPGENDRRVSRRQFSRLFAASTAVLLTGEAQAETTELPVTTAPPATDEARIARIESERGVPFTPEQRRMMSASLKDLDETTAALRKAAVSDGGSEPVTAFSPLLAARRTKKGA